jgi:hypothetical protein
MADPPEVMILMLGDSEVGKTTFLSYVAIPFLLRGFFSNPTAPPRSLSPLLSACLLEFDSPR